MEIIAELLSFFGFLALLAVWFFCRLKIKEKRLRKIAARRELTYDQFLLSVGPSANECVAESVYDHLQLQLAWACIEFPVAPEDELKKDYDMDQGDVRFLLELVIDECPEVDPDTSAPPIRKLTVAEFISYVSGHTKKPKSAATRGNTTPNA